MNCYKCQTPLPENSRFCLSCGADVSGDTHEHTLAVEAPDPELQKKLQDELGTDYILERELGRGGMAVVFLGHDAHLGRRVAVKVLPPELTFGGGGIIERFKREARTAATLDHPNIIPVYRVSTGGKLFWYVMKYLEGESLDHIIEREGQLPVDRSARILTQVAEALGYAHKKSVVHRDVKPANVMLDADDRVTVTDFGIAKALDANTLTASGSMIGTPYYMSPEQCSGKRVTGASDQYSLSVMAYQMLGGHVPFTGDSVVEIIKKHCMDPVPPLGVLRPNLPQPLIAVVERALAKSPEERFTSVVDFAKAFAAGAQGLDVTLAPPVKVTPGRASKTAIVSPIPGALRTVKGRAGRWLWIAGGAGVLAVAAAAVVVLGPRRRAAEQPSLPAPAGPPSIGQPQQPLLALGADTTRAAARETTAAAAPPPTTPPSARPARLTLRGVPDGATVTRDGQPVRGNTVELTPGRRHTVTVTKGGFQPWTESFTPREGQQLSRTVTLTALAQATPGPQQPPAPGAAPPQAAPVQQAPPQQQPPAAPAPAAAAQPSLGYISVGTNPRSTIYVNNQAAPRFPLVNFPVQPGPVRLRFQVADSTGLWWAPDREVTVRAGDTLRLGFIRLVRQP